MAFHDWRSQSPNRDGWSCRLVRNSAKKRIEALQGEAGNAANHGKPEENKTKSLEERADGKNGF